jgi:hypothetical protein
VFVAKTKRVHRVRPESIRYAVDKNGFSFAADRETNKLTIRRNDGKLFNPTWMKRTGLKKLMQSMGKR